ncbi:hypothetical protein [Xylophilus sp. GOD-11R]|uniref:hypothetical protein n=1 Tax=Xylophilus sp. GOD-11R TaxID=3089814 RepID=UPI00298D409C|nr:hypothetical protein [Xylophilus sp. GOD-11R]WPB55020.1 hypothetical protein R9X41_12655 [Xylophilus sp. GOD-11R]
MTDSSDPLDGCHCCEDIAGPRAVRNDPGLPALRYRIDTQPGFYARMLQSLPLRRADEADAGSARPLARLLSRAPDDPAIALIDASACVADVLTFYQERIANEGYLRTATERRSVLELARAVGYELNPGVAAATHLAFTVEDAPGAPGVCTLAAGLPVQSVPPQGKLPQVFETGAEITARAEWNELRPRLLRPADIAVLEVPGTEAGTTRLVLALLGPAGGFPPATPRLHTGLVSASLFRLDPALVVDATVDALEVGTVYFNESTGGVAQLARGDLLLFVGRRGESLSKLILRVVAAVPEATLKRVRIDLEPLPEPGHAAPPPANPAVVPYTRKPVLSFARAQITAVPFTGHSLATTVVGQAWRERDLQAMIGIQGWHRDSLVRAIGANTAPAPAPVPASTPVAPPPGAFAFGARIGFFGHNAPKWAVLPKGSNLVHGEAYAQGWDPGDTGVGAAPRNIWTDSQGSTDALAPHHVYLERPVPDVSRAGWVVFDAPDAGTRARAYTVFDVREASRADYGLSGRALGLRLAGDDGQLLDPKPNDTYPFRSTTAHVASRRLALADLPIDTPVAAGDTAIELDRMVLGLVAGQPVALMGERVDLPGVQVAEIAVIADVVHADGRSTLLLRQGLVYGYGRRGLAISANVVPATHGETVTELLGNGDASLPNQRFTLKKPPTTFVSAPTDRGVRSTLEVRVGGVRWDEVTALYGQPADGAVFSTAIDDDARMELVFGDGVQGARLPTGSANISARYRSGIGPDGEVAAGTLTMLRAMPLGLRGVSNPVPATGAEGPERLADARRSAPLTLLTFDRIVSLSDHEDFARAWPGIGKARADLLWIDGATRVVVTVAGATGGPPGAEVLANLRLSMRAAGDTAQRFIALAYLPRYFSCRARVATDPRRVAAEVLDAVSATLLQAFGFEARGLGQSVTAAEVIALMHTVPGVVAVDLDELLPYTDASPPAAVAEPVAVPCFGARWDAARRAVSAAELLLINPAALDLVEMTP